MELGHYLDVNKIDVAVVQETKLRSSDRTPSFPGFSVVRQDRAGSSARGGGLLTLVRHDVPYRVLPTNRSEDSALESLSISVPTGGGDKLTIVNVYCPPTRAGQNQVEARAAGFHPSSLPCHRGVLIAGDLNSHSPLWDPFQPGDASGEDLEHWLVDHGMMCLNDGSATRVNRGSGGLSSPDIAFVHGSRLAGCEWRTTDRLGSDHTVMQMDLECGVRFLRKPGPTRRSWNWKKADWEKFSAGVERALAQGESDLQGGSLDDRALFLSRTVLEAARTHIGETKARPSARPWMTREIRAAVRERNALGRRLGECREEWLAACKRVRDLIAKEKERRWRSFTGKLESSTEPAKVWRVIRSLGGSGAASGGKNEVLVHGNRELSTGSDKANAFCTHYAAVSRLEFSKEERLFGKGVRRRLRGLPLESDDLPECAPFTEAELARALQQAASNTACGEDGVAPRFLKHLGALGRQFLLRLLNGSWIAGYLPQTWRTALIVPIPKAGKKPGIDSHRPISLTSCVGKVLERMIAARLQHLAEGRGLLAQEQAGFRRRRCCEDQVLRLSQSVSDGFQRVPSQRTLLAMLDYSKAFDTVWREALLEKLMEAGIPRRYVVWVSGFLRNRLGRVVFDGEKSRRKVFRQGLPQGSVLSPLLFLFFINSVVEVVPGDVNVSLYADDVAVWTSDRRKEAALHKVRSAVAAIAQWSVKWKLRLSETKCTVSFFSQHPGEASWSPSFEVEGKTLRFEPNPVFLGVKFDRVLSFKAHAEMVAARAVGRSRVLSMLAGQDWGWRRASLLPVFLAFVRSVLDYCAAGWQPWLARSSFEILTRAQNRALRLVTGQCRTTPTEALALEAGVPQYPTVARTLWLRAYEKALRLPLGHPRRVAAECSVPHRMKRNSSWRREASNLATELGLGEPERTPFGPASTAPWNWLGWGDAVVATDLEEGAPEDSLRALAETSVHRWNGGTVIYTDGSLIPASLIGGCSAILLDGPAGEELVTDGAAVCLLGASSSFEVEVRALRLAVQLAARHPRVGRVVICSDSRSALDALRLPSDGDADGITCLRLEILQAGAAEVCLQWVPGHCGLRGNEIADRVAKASAGVGMQAGAPVVDVSVFGSLSDNVWAVDPGREVGPSEFVGPDVADVVHDVADVERIWWGRVRFLGVENVGRSFVGAVSHIRRLLIDPPPAHPRVALVYGTAGGTGAARNSTVRSLDSCCRTRADAVLLAQLRSGHCPALAAYRALYLPGADSNCPFCFQAPQTLEHWLRDCDALAPRRLTILGTAFPSLAVMTTNPVAVAAYARATLPRGT